MITFKLSQVLNIAEHAFRCKKWQHFTQSEIGGDPPFATAHDHISKRTITDNWNGAMNS
jgi:hypothetical protein